MSFLGSVWFVWRCWGRGGVQPWAMQALFVDNVRFVGNCWSVALGFCVVGLHEPQYYYYNSPFQTNRTSTTNYACGTHGCPFCLENVPNRVCRTNIVRRNVIFILLAYTTVACYFSLYYYYHACHKKSTINIFLSIFFTALINNLCAFQIILH